MVISNTASVAMVLTVRQEGRTFFVIRFAFSIATALDGWTINIVATATTHIVT
jgi:hypothetical protein